MLSMKVKLTVVPLLASMLVFLGGQQATAASRTCAPSGPCGDTDASGSVSATDALRTLRKAVGLSVSLKCECTGIPQVFGIPASGQSNCWGNDAPATEVPCAGTGQDGESQLGVPRSFTDNNNGTVTDGVTGLIWEKLSDDGSLHSIRKTYTWQEAFERVAALNDANFAGSSDWRLPNVVELGTLQNFGGIFPALFSGFYTECPPACTVLSCNCPVASNVWSSSTWLQDTDSAWVADFATGNRFAAIKSDKIFTRAVRGGE